ncbi:hypothetical protein HID58_092445 [Brassica napus]|uniref:Yippee domain-containing protein n=1 Tax=Brassica napus TaxID=3708 RepID=A0ABQ7WWK4_BRANA|nr:hypothetical protein HID58_092445 [Brassica napus]
MEGFVIELEGAVYTCKKCHTHLALPSDIISKNGLTNMSSLNSSIHFWLKNGGGMKRSFVSFVTDQILLGYEAELHGPEGSDDEMGRMFEIELEGPFYTCIKCHTHLGLPNDIISKEIDQFGRYEYEFTRLFNTFLGERPFNSAVKDIFCVGCSNIIGIYGVTGGSYWVLRNELHGPEGSDDECVNSFMIRSHIHEKSERHGLVEGRSWYQQDRKLNRDQRPSENHPPQRNRDTYGKHLSHRDNHSRRFQPYGSSRYSRGAGGTNSRSTNYREVYRPLQPPINQAPPPPALPVRDRLSPRDTGRIDSIREESSSCKRTTPTSAKGTPLNESKLDQTTEALNAAREELRVTMTQYISCTDPAESAARRERVRQAEQNGIIEDSVSQMARAALARHQSPKTCLNSPDRTPALHRLGSLNPQAQETENILTESPKRTPALLRLGQASPPNQLPNPPTESAPVRRKPGRPPGTRKGASSPKSLVGYNSRKRKVQQTKPPTCKRKLSVKTGNVLEAGPSRRKNGDSQKKGSLIAKEENETD